jgi:hypothetical protein
MNLLTVISSIIMRAANQIVPGRFPRTLNRRRSTYFVYQLALAFHGYHLNNPLIAVFSRKAPWHRSLFGVNEVMFDISVVELSQHVFSRVKPGLPFISKAQWLVESELALRSRNLLHDFSKLVLANSDTLLFIASQFKDRQAQLDMLASVAAYCKCNLYLILVPRPSLWTRKQPNIEAFEFVNNGWSRTNNVVA